MRTKEILAVSIVAASSFLATPSPTLAGQSPAEIARVHQMLDDWTEMHRLEGSAENVDAFFKAVDKYSKICQMGYGEPKIGMTTFEVLATSWCVPDDIHTTETADGTAQQWSYKPSHASRSVFVYFQQGRVVAISQ